MPRKIKIWGVADFLDRGKVTNVQQQFKVVMANYNVIPQDSDSVLMAAHFAPDNVAVTFMLPQVATANGRVFSFYNMNAGSMGITAELWNSGTIIASANGAANSVVYALSGNNIAGSCRFLCDGAAWYHQHLGPHTIPTNAATYPYSVT